MRRFSGADFSRYLALVRVHTRGRRGMFMVVVAALVAGAGVQVASPLVVRAFLDLAQAGAALERLLRVAVLFICVALAGSALDVVRSHAGTVLAWQAMNSLRRTLFRHTVDLGHSFFARSSPGTLLERIDGDVAKLGRLLSDLLMELVANLLMTAGVIVVLLFEDWRVGVAVAAFAVVGALVVDRVRALGVPASYAAAPRAPPSSGAWANGSRRRKSYGHWADNGTYAPVSSGFWRTGCHARSPRRSPATRCPWPTRCCSSAGWRSD